MCAAGIAVRQELPFKRCCKKGENKGEEKHRFPAPACQVPLCKIPFTPPLVSLLADASSSTECSFVTSHGLPWLPDCCLNCCTPSVSLLRLVYSDNRSLTFVRPHPAFAPPVLTVCSLPPQWISGSWSKTRPHVRRLQRHVCSSKTFSYHQSELSRTPKPLACPELSWTAPPNWTVRLNSQLVRRPPYISVNVNAGTRARTRPPGKPPRARAVSSRGWRASAWLFRWMDAICRFSRRPSTSQPPHGEDFGPQTAGITSWWSRTAGEKEALSCGEIRNDLLGSRLKKVILEENVKGVDIRLHSWREEAREREGAQSRWSGWTREGRQ